MATLLEKYPIDLTPVHRAEAILGIKLPDLLEPVRTLDADVDAIRAQVDEYLAIADEIEQVMQEVTAIRSSYALEGETAETADGFWDVVLAILGALAGVIIALVGALLVVVGALIRVIGEILTWIGDAIEWLENAIFLVVTAILGVFLRGEILEWAKRVWNFFKKRSLGILGFVGLAAGALGVAGEVVGKAVMWLGYWLMEQGGRLGGDDRFADGMREERDRLFAAAPSAPGLSAAGAEAT